MKNLDQNCHIVISNKRVPDPVLEQVRAADVLDRDGDSEWC